jgi:hypothetical protein
LCGGGAGLEEEVEAGDLLGEDIDLAGLLLDHVVEGLELVAAGLRGGRVRSMEGSGERGDGEEGTEGAGER